MTDPLTSYSPGSTPQSEQVRSDQVVNHAGGYVFPVTDTTRATRFLILGTEGGTYYQSERDHTRENAKFICDMANSEEGGMSLLTLVTDVSLEGRAKKQNPTLFALAALCCSESDRVRRNALLMVPSICRTGTMLFIFARYMKTLRGTWPRGYRRAVARWYEQMDPMKLAYQVTKYAQREGFSHRDLLRLAHPKAVTSAHAGIYNYVTKGTYLGDSDPTNIEVGNYLRTIDSVNSSPADVGYWAEAARETKLSWEQLPDEALSHPEVWDAMLENLGLTALVRNLGRLSKIDYLKPLGDDNEKVIRRLLDDEGIARSLIHPLAVLLAASTYAKGQGVKGSMTWEPVPQVSAALDEMFYKSFGNVEPTNKRTLVALDVSGSMTWGNIAGTFLTPREAAAALAMVTLRTEPRCHVTAFSHEMVQLGLNPAMSLPGVIEATSGLPFGGTDCALPMLYAMEKGLEVDTFVVITDNETWYGRIHPFQALKEYRKKTGIPARLAVIAMTATNFSIADPSDAGMLDLVGFDTATPEILRQFSLGEL